MGEEDFSSHPPGVGNAVTWRMSRPLQGGGLWPSDGEGGHVSLPKARELMKKIPSFSETGPDCPHLPIASLVRRARAACPAWRWCFQRWWCTGGKACAPLVWHLPSRESFLCNGNNNRSPFWFGQGWKMSSCLYILAVEMESVNFTEN